VAWVREGRAARVPGNLDPAEYLEGKPFRFRFPFPDEDNPDERARLEGYARAYALGLELGKQAAPQTGTMSP